MVYQHIQSDQNQQQDKQHFSQPALLDRFFAFLIDYLALSPFVSFFTFLFFKDAVNYWRTNPNAPELNSIFFILSVSVVLFFSFMQAVSIYFWKATPGQYFLKMRIEFEHSSQMIFWRAFLRQLGFCLSPLFLGIPWIAMLSHPQRKAFYDRLADCRVVSLRTSSSSFTFENESTYWRSLVATLILFVGLLCGSVMWFKYEKITQRVASFEKLDKQKYFCADLKDIHITQRLQMAIAMNLVGSLSDDCLDKEADFTLWKSKTGDFDLAYFAKYLTEENAEAQSIYLKQSCAQSDAVDFNEQSLGCQMALSFADGEFEKIYDNLDGFDGILPQVFKYELTRTLEKDLDVQASFKSLQKYDAHKLIQKYLLSEMLAEKTSDDTNRSPASANLDEVVESVHTQIFDEELAQKWIDDL